MNWDLPYGWRWQELGQVARFVAPAARTAELPVLTFKGLMANGTIALSDPASGRFAVGERNDVVFTRQGHVAGWALKKVGRLTDASPVHVAPTLMICRPLDVSPRWLELWLSSRDVYQTVTEALGGRTSITKDVAAKIPVPVPPSAVQGRIVDTLEDYLSGLDAADGYIDAASRRVNRLRESWLARSLPTNLPSAESFTIADALVSSRGGWSRSRAHLVEPPSGVPYLKMHNISRSGSLELRDVARVAASDADVARYGLCDGDVLFNSKNSGDLVGKTAVADSRVAGWVFNENIMRLRFDDRLLPSFVGLWFQGPSMRRQIMDAASASTNVAAVYMHTLSGFRLWIPDMPLQAQLVDEFEALQGSMGRLLDSAADNAARLRRLRAAALSAAFSGRLTGHSSDLDRAEEVAFA